MQKKHSIFHNINILSSVFHVKNFNLVSYAKRFSLWPTTVSMTCKNHICSKKMALVQSFPHLLFLQLWVVSWPFTSLVTHTPSAMCKCARVQYSSIRNCQSIPLQVLPTHQVQCASVSHTPSAMCKCALQHIIGSQDHSTAQSAISSSFYCKCAVQCIWCNFQSVTLQCPMYIWLNCIAM